MVRQKTSQQRSAPEPVERLRAAGLRVTAPRVAILSLLERNWEHPSVDELHHELHAEYPSLSLSTVYATLETFARSGLCRRIQGADGRLRVDGTLHAHEHDHGVCRSCGRIFDVDRDEFRIPEPPQRLPRGLHVLGVHVEYDVICAPCRRGGRVGAQTRKGNKR